MANTNQILPFGTGAGSNVLDPAVWAALAARQTGFQSGVAQSAAVNTAIRQASFAAAMIAQFTADNGAASVLDDGNLAAFEANFVSALVAAMSAQLGAGSTRYSTDTGAANAMVVTHLTALQDGQILVVNPAATNTGPTVIDVGVAVLGVILNDGATALAGGEIQKNVRILLVYDATLSKWRLINPHGSGGGGGSPVTAVPNGGLAFTALSAGKLALENLPVPAGALSLNDIYAFFSVADNGDRGATLGAILAAAFSAFGLSIGASGYITLPGGLIIQWITGPTDPTSPADGVFYTLNWPLAFPNKLQAALISTSINTATNADVNYEIVNGTTNAKTQVGLTRNLQTGYATVLTGTNAVIIGIGN
ncbi:gp53-like domain-containing protein [Labrys neptuniae]